MKTLIVAAIRCSLIFLVPTVTYAVSAHGILTRRNERDER